MAYSGVYVFGDSLVDAGNALKLAEWYGDLTFSDLPDGAPTAEEGYYKGRFTDGYAFTDLLANKLIGVATKPVFPFGYEDPWMGIPISPLSPDPTGNNLNFAYGGSQIRRGEEAVPDLDEQTDAFKDAIDNRADPLALYSVTLGGNDVRDLVDDDSNPVSAALAHDALDLAADKMLRELTQLVDIGARKFLITGIPDVGLIPDYDINGNNFLDHAGTDLDGNGRVDAYEAIAPAPGGDVGEAGRAAVATEYSAYLDGLLKSKVVAGLEAYAQSRGITVEVDFVQVADVRDAQGNVIAQGALSLNLPTLAALHGLTLADLTTNMLEHQQVLFFDHIHPTGQAHALLAGYIHAQLTGTPWVETLPLDGTKMNFLTSGAISVVAEVDKVSVSLIAGTTYTFEMLGIASLGIGGAIGDGALRILTPGGTAVTAFQGVSGDDAGVGFDATWTFTAQSTGTYTIELRGVGAMTGAYAVQGGVVGGTSLTRGDTYTVSNAGTGVVEGVGGAGTDIVKASVSYTLSPGSEIEELHTSNAKGKTALNLTGNEFAQKIVGNAGDNVIDGRGGADQLTGGAGKDRFVFGEAAYKSGAVAAITDYASADVVDVSTLVKVAAGVNVLSGGYVRLTAGGVLEVDINGNGDNWVALTTVGTASSVNVRYSSGTTTANVSVARSTDAQKAQSASATTAVMAGTVAAAGVTSGEPTAAATLAYEPMTDGGNLMAAGFAQSSFHRHFSETVRATFALEAREAVGAPELEGGLGQVAAAGNFNAAALYEAAPDSAAPAALLAATDLPAAAMAASSSASETLFIPSAESLSGIAAAELAAVANGPVAAMEVERVLADTLALGDGQLDSLVSAIGGGDSGPGLSHLAAMADSGAFTAPLPLLQAYELAASLDAAVA